MAKTPPRIGGVRKKSARRAVGGFRGPNLAAPLGVVASNPVKRRQLPLDRCVVSGEIPRGITRTTARETADTRRARPEAPSIACSGTPLSTGAPVSFDRANKRPCPGYWKDRVVPLACGGPDAVSNL